MHILIAFVLAVQQWTPAIQVSPDTLLGFHPAVCVDDMGDAWVCWFSSNRLYAKRHSRGFWSGPYLIDTAACILPEVTTSSTCKGAYEFPAWIVAWTDSDHHIRLSLCNMMPMIPSWNTTAADSRIMGSNPSVTYDRDGKIWCAWTSMTDSISCYLRSYYDGDDWAEPDTLFRFTPVEVTYTAGIAADKAGDICILLNDHQEIYMTGSIDGGITWSPWLAVDSCYDYAYPVVCGEDSEFWAAWYDGDGGVGGDLFMTHGDIDTWSRPIGFPGENDIDGWFRAHQDLCVEGGDRLWAGWCRDMGIVAQNYMILAGSYREEWADVDTVYEGWFERGGNPCIDCSDEQVWIVWQHAAAGGYHIFASHNVLTGLREPTELRIHHPLLQIYPNPSTSCYIIRYNVPRSVHVSLKIYGSGGRLTRSLVDGSESSGLHMVTWDGRDDSGARVVSGSYFLRFEAHTPRSVHTDLEVWTGLATGDYTATRKLCVVR